MRNLIEFLTKNNYWFVFVVLEVVSLVLLFRFNSYQGSVWFSSANYLTGKAYEIDSWAASFLTQASLNEQLTQRNVQLEHRVEQLQQELRAERMSHDSLYMKRGQMRLLGDFNPIYAKVIGNSVNRPLNFITIDKGSADGVREDMGVACGNGVVGVVFMTSKHYSVVLPALNSKSNISCAIAGRGYFGYLHWSGGSPRVAYVDDIPRHAKFEVGDTIVTSGYSAVFPPGILVGKVTKFENSDDGLSYRLRVLLSTDFANLRDVCVIDDKAVRERLDMLRQANDSIQPRKND